MNWLELIFSNIGGVIITALLLVFLNAMGVLDKLLALFKKNGNGNKNGYQIQIDELKKHAEISNQEMGEVKEQLVALNVKADIILKHLKI